MHFGTVPLSVFSKTKFISLFFTPGKKSRVAVLLYKSNAFLQTMFLTTLHKGFCMLSFILPLSESSIKLWHMVLFCSQHRGRENCAGFGPSSIKKQSKAKQNVNFNTLGYSNTTTK